MNISKHLISASVALTVLYSTNVVANDFLADGKADKSGLHGFVGLGVGAVPEYEGAEDYQMIPFMVGRIQQEYRYAEILGTSLRANVLNHENFQLGPVLNFRFGRDDSIDNAILSRLSEIDDAFELGVFARYDYSTGWRAGDSLGISTRFLHDVSDAHEGFEASVGIDYNTPITQKLRMGVDLSTSYGSSDYMNTYYSVTSQNVGASGLSNFDAESGFKDASIGVNGQYAFDQRWGLYSRVSYTRLLGDASDSPIVDDEGNDNQFLAGAGVSYRF